MAQNKCFCGSHKISLDCCEPFVNGTKKAPTAEALMRSRYVAYVTHAIDYLVETTHVSERKYHLKSDILNWSVSNKWLKLEIIKATENTVEFKAYFIDSNGNNQIHHEDSSFVFENGSWFYVDGSFY
jgi:SEC-C motif-containing protein